MVSNVNLHPDSTCTPYIEASLEVGGYGYPALLILNSNVGRRCKLTLA